MTSRTTTLCAITAALLALTTGSLALTVTDSINAQLSAMACRRTPDALCASI